MAGYVRDRAVSRERARVGEMGAAMGALPPERLSYLQMADDDEDPSIPEEPRGAAEGGEGGGEGGEGDDGGAWPVP